MKIKTLKQLEIQSEKNTIFVSPEYSNWQDQLNDNQSAAPDSQHRSTARNQLLQIARAYTSQLLPGTYCQQKPENIIVTGHQPIWHHPGILAKNIVASKFTRQIKGTCIHLVVDHDIGDSDMTLPFSNQDQMLDFMKIPIENNQRNIPFELRSKPDLKMINNLISSIAKNYPENLCCQLWSEHLKKHPEIIFSLENTADIITSLQAVLNNALGIEMLYLPTSQMSQNNSFIKFAASIIKNHEKFAYVYNDAIAKNHTHNNFKILDIDSLEKAALPLWLVTASGLRTCMYVKKTNSSTITITTMNRELGTVDLTSNIIPQLKSILNEHQLFLRPKAVTMMLFVRLFLSDFFIHGIGGGSYKKITNFILNNYYNLKKTDAAIATATATLPLKQSPQQYDIKILNQNIRKIHYNPENYIDKTLLKNDCIKKTIENKKNMIRQACDQNISSQQKQDAWKNINMINSELIKYAQPSIKKLEEKIQLAKQFQHTTEVLNYRQFFFGLFSENFLKDFSKPEIET